MRQFILLCHELQVSKNAVCAFKNTCADGMEKRLDELRHVLGKAEEEEEKMSKSAMVVKERGEREGG